MQVNVGLANHRVATAPSIDAGTHEPSNVTIAQSLGNDAATDVLLDQFYTREDVAEHLYEVFRRHFDATDYLMVEPSAGTGAFLRFLPGGTLAFDIDPKHPSIETADFLKVRIASERRVATIGNPPFGRNASTAIRFFNHAAIWSDAIAFILPRSFRKASVENRLDRRFHLVHEELVRESAFLFRSKPYSVPATFQIWERRSSLRPLRLVETSHPDFVFMGPGGARFAIQRVGANAGRMHRDFGRSPSAHYFIGVAPGNCGNDVEGVMRELDFASVSGDVAGNRSLAKSEIIALYKRAKS